MDSQMTAHPQPRPAMTWVEVTDHAGRTRLEARWSAPVSPAQAITDAHAA